MRWYESCVLSNVAGDSTFKITGAKPYVPVVTLSTEDNAKLSKLLTEGFKKSVYWNEYKVITEQRYNANDNIRTLIDPNWQGINRLFALPYLNDANSTVNSHRKYFFTRVKIENYNIEIDGRNLYDQPINEWTKQYNKIWRIFRITIISNLAGPLVKLEIPLAKNVLAPLRITAAASPIDAGIQENVHGSGTTILIISDKAMNDIMRIVQTLEDSNILLKGVTKTFKN